MAVSRYLDTEPMLGERVFVHDSAQVIGDVVLGADVSIWCGAVLRGDVHSIRIGEGSNIQDLSVCHVTHRSVTNPAGFPLIVGSRVTVGHGVILHGCTIENECLVGMGSLILDGAILERHVLLGAGSLVPPGKRLESGFLYLGRPALKIRPLTEEEIAHFHYSAENYIRLKNDYL
jgi:carbonic anhydrase/acetyltransferase-like protein (isoleucine patch superfamily)